MIATKINLPVVFYCMIQKNKSVKMDIAPKNLGMLGTFLYETSIEYKIYYQHT